jgi:UDP-3-O-[3-hydroxymyristoyl] glucosamine N-acyltransferase
MNLQQLARQIGATVSGDDSVIITGCAAIDHAGPSQVTFVANAKYAAYLPTTKAAAVIVDARTECPANLTRLIADDPYYAFRNAVIALHGFREHPNLIDPAAECGNRQVGQGAGGRDASTNRQIAKSPNAQVSRSAVIHPTAIIGDGSVIHPNVVIEANAAIGCNCVLYPGVYIGPEARLGDECLLYPNVVVYDRCVLGNRVILHSSTVIGHDGFGYATHRGAHHKIPQTGIAVVEDDVEMGAGCAIERAAMGETRIGKGTKFADLISIGHGTTVGKHCLFVSLVGVSGSVEIGDYVVLGGQVGVAGHLRIGNRVQAAARTAIVQDVPDGMKIGGVPAIDLDKAKRNALAGTELYQLTKRVRALERELERLRQPTEE